MAIGFADGTATPALSSPGFLDDCFKAGNSLFRRDPIRTWCRPDSGSLRCDHWTVLDVDSGNHAARMSAAKALANFHKHAEVLALIERYSTGRPREVDEFELHHLRGVALRGLGRYEEAEGELLAASRLRPRPSNRSIM